MGKREVENIRQWLESFFDQEENRSYFLVDVTHNPKETVYRVYIDGDNGVNYRTCTAVSRFLESRLDAEQNVPENYVLEVSSPGAAKPLKLLRQYPQHIGRVLEVKMQDGNTWKMKLQDVQGDQLYFVQSDPPKGKRKKQTEVQERTVRIDEIRKAIVKLSFK